MVAPWRPGIPHAPPRNGVADQFLGGAGAPFPRCRCDSFEINASSQGGDRVKRGRLPRCTRSLADDTDLALQHPDRRFRTLVGALLLALCSMTSPARAAEQLDRFRLNAGYRECGS